MNASLEAGDGLTRTQDCVPEASLLTKQTSPKPNLPYVILSPVTKDSPSSGSTCGTQPTALKLIRKLNQSLCEYRQLVKCVGTSPDGLSMREEMAELRERTLQDIASCHKHLALSFKNSETLSAKELQKLEQICRILVASIHTLDRELRLTRHLFHIFPLFCDLDGNRDEYGLVKTGLSEASLCKKASQKSWQSSPVSLTALYWEERESWQQLESEILLVHDLDLSLHRDSILGPVVDYLTLGPTGGSSTEELTMAMDNTVLTSLQMEDQSVGTTTHHACIVFSILIMLFIGGGVLIGVIFIIVG